MVGTLADIDQDEWKLASVGNLPVYMVAYGCSAKPSAATAKGLG